MDRSPLCLALALLLGSGCATTADVSYGPRPLPPMAPSGPEQCMVDNGIQLGSASTSIVWREGEWSNRRSMSGIAFYQHRDRLSPSRALRLLDDRALEASYRERSDALGRGLGWAKFRYKGGMYLMGISLVVSVAAMFAGDAGLPMALGGLGGTLIGGGMVASAWGRVPDMKTHNAYGKFVFEEDMAARARSAAERYNAGVATRCLGGQAAAR